MCSRTHPARACVVLVLLAGSLACGRDTSNTAGAPSDVDEITVAAASDLRTAFEEIGERFTTESGIRVTFSFGASGQLRQQIVNGAPFDVFASANLEFVDDVITAGRGDPTTRAEYARGRLALWVPHGAHLPATVEDLADPAYRRVAIANPAHAPYGLAAEQALRSAGVRDRLADRLVLGENVSDALRVARSGNADVAIVALSLVEGDPVDRYRPVPEDLHEPLRQALVVTAGGARARAARAFADYVTSPVGARVLADHGLAPPAAAAPTPTPARSGPTG